MRSSPPLKISVWKGSICNPSTKERGLTVSLGEMTGTRFNKRFKFKNNHTYETQSQNYICTCTYTHIHTHIRINTRSCTSCFCQLDANLESSWKRELSLKACLHQTVCRQIYGTFSLLMIKVESPSPLGVGSPQVSCPNV